MLRRPLDGFHVVQKHAVQEDRDVGGRDQLMARETRRDEHEIVHVPFARLANRVRKRRELAVDAADRAVGIRRILIAVKDLDLELAHEEHARIAAALPFALHFGGRRELQMQLAVAEFRARMDVARARNDFHVAVLKLPLRLFVVFAQPVAEAFAVEQDDCVRRRNAGRLLRAETAGGHDTRLRTVAVMDMPAAARNDRCVAVTNAFLDFVCHFASPFLVLLNGLSVLDVFISGFRSTVGLFCSILSH